jgi:phage terminase small subunit
MKEVKQKYRKTSMLTPAKKKFAQVFAQTDNASEAARQAYPHLSTNGSQRQKGYELLTNTDILMEIKEQKQKLEEISSKGVRRLEQLVGSEKENIALDATKFAIEQVHGKAKQKHEHHGQYVFVTYDLSGGEAEAVPQEILDQLKEQ